jgi:hypothetical protein
MAGLAELVWRYLCDESADREAAERLVAYDWVEFLIHALDREQGMSACASGDEPLAAPFSFW